MNFELVSFEWLAEGFLKSGLILALGLVGASAFRRSTPEFRHRLWMPLFIIVLAAPALLLLPRWEVVPAFLTAPVSNPEPLLTTIDFAAVETRYEVIGEKSQAKTEPARTIDWRLVVLAVWALGAAGLLLRMAIGCLRVARWRNRAEAGAVPEWILDRAEQLRREFGIAREITVIISEKVRSPFAWGWHRPLVALPAEATEWNAADLDMILRHELTHLARRDSVSVWITGLVTALNWPNPLAWLASKRVTELREQICDREVLNAGCDSERYATLLFGHARRRVAPFPVSATAVARPGTLEKRIAMILKPSSKTIHHPGNRLRHLLLAGFLGLSVAIVFLGLARPLTAEEEDAPSGNARLIINTYHDPKTSKFDRLGFELNGEKFGFEKLEKSLRPIAKQNTVLALVPAAPLPMKELKRVIDVAETAGIRSLIFEKRPELPSGGHGDSEVAEDPFGAPSEKQISITTRFVEVEKKEASEPSLLTKKLNAIVIPSIEFVETPLEDVLDFLEAKAVELDEQTPDPDARGVNFVLKGDDKFRRTPLTLELSNTSLAQILHFTGQLAGAEIRVDDNAVFIQATKGPDTPANWIRDDKARELTNAKLDAIVVPSIEFHETPLRDALEFLKSRSVELDHKSPDPSNRGVNMVLMSSGAESGEESQVSLRLKNVTLRDALRYVTALTDLAYDVQGNAVVIFEKRKPDTQADPFGQ